MQLESDLRDQDLGRFPGRASYFSLRASPELFYIDCMETKRIRVGLISEKSEDAVKLKAEYPDTYVTHGRNILELHQQSGQNKLNAILFLNIANIQKEYFSIHQFLRSKKDFSQLPIALLTQEPLLFHKTNQ